MAKYIKNNSGVTDTWAGQELTNGQVYQLNFEDELRFIVNSRIVGGKIETDVASGALQVSQDNFTTTLSAADAIVLLRADNAQCIQDVLVDDSGKQDGYALKYDSTLKKIIYGPVITGNGDEFATVSLKRSTSFALTTTAQDISFDVEDVENKPTIIEHDNTNTARIILRDPCLFYGITNLEIINTANQDRTFTIELWRNGTQLLSSTDIVITKSTTEHVTRAMVIPTLAANDYVTLRMKGSTASDLSLGANSRVIVFQLKGAAGPTGAKGADGDMTWEGTWLNQNYVENQAVYYAPTGQSYVCHTNTTTSQNPTDTNYWDLLVQKGDQGPAGTSSKNVDLTIHAHNASFKQTGSTTYDTQAEFIFLGTTKLGAPSKIKILSWKQSGGNYSARIYDATNAQTICEITNQGNTTRNVIDMGTLSNLPTGNAVLYVQLKAGTGEGASAAVSGLTLEY